MFNARTTRHRVNGPIEAGFAPFQTAGTLSTVPFKEKLSRNRFRLRLPRQQLSQHVLQYAPIRVIESFLRSINANHGLKFRRLPAFYSDRNLAARRKFLDPFANSRHLTYSFRGH